VQARNINELPVNTHCLARSGWEAEKEEHAPISGWVDMTDEDDAVLCEHLHRDDGSCLGLIVR
jgi:hypothetical protein